jgi:hypothetical protein
VSVTSNGLHGVILQKTTFFFNVLLRLPRLNSSMSLQCQCFTPESSMMQVTHMLPVHVGRGQKFTAVCCTLQRLLRIPCMQLISVVFNCMETDVLVRPSTLNQMYQETFCPQSASELYPPSDRCLLAKLLPTFTDRGCHVVSVRIPTVVFSGF